MGKQLISIIVPFQNEASNLTAIHTQLTQTMQPLTDYDYEIIFVDDGSTDNSNQEVRALEHQDHRVVIIEFVRNFGKEIAISAGLQHARGDAAIIIDADLQHPVELIPEFLAKWQDGAEVVVGVRSGSKGHSSWSKRFGSRWFYRMMGIISNTPITPNATDYRLLDRSVINEFNRFTERNRMTRGLIDWLGFEKALVHFEPHNRIAGKPAYSYLKLLKLAINSMVSLSFFPLKLAGYLGVFIVFVSAPLGIFLFYEKYLSGNPILLGISGTSMLAVMLLFLVGIILCCLGLIALYIEKIYGEVINRPLYVLRPKKTHHIERKAEGQ